MVCFDRYVDALIGLCRNKHAIVLDDYYAVRMLFLLERILCFGLSKGFFSPFTLWEVIEGSLRKNLRKNGSVFRFLCHSKFHQD